MRRLFLLALLSVLLLAPVFAQTDSATRDGKWTAILKRLGQVERRAFILSDSLPRFGYESKLDELAKDESLSLTQFCKVFHYRPTASPNALFLIRQYDDLISFPNLSAGEIRDYIESTEREMALVVGGAPDGDFADFWRRFPDAAQQAMRDRSGPGTPLDALPGPLRDRIICDLKRDALRGARRLQGITHHTLRALETDDLAFGTKIDDLSGNTVSLYGLECTVDGNRLFTPVAPVSIVRMSFVQASIAHAPPRVPDASDPRPGDYDASGKPLPYNLEPDGRITLEEYVRKYIGPEAGVDESIKDKVFYVVGEPKLTKYEAARFLKEAFGCELQAKNQKDFLVASSRRVIPSNLPVRERLLYRVSPVILSLMNGARSFANEEFIRRLAPQMHKLREQIERGETVIHSDPGTAEQGLTRHKEVLIHRLRTVMSDPKALDKPGMVKVKDLDPDRTREMRYILPLLYLQDTFMMVAHIKALPDFPASGQPSDLRLYAESELDNAGGEVVVIRLKGPDGQDRFTLSERIPPRKQ